MITASGSAVTLADQVASNGVLHLVDRVMYPLSLDNNVQYLAKNPDLGTLLYSLAETTLPGVLQGNKPTFSQNRSTYRGEGGRGAVLAHPVFRMRRTLNRGPMTIFQDKLLTRT